MAALLLDGIHVAERCCIVALTILADGRKVPVGRWEGSTENATVVRHLLADLQGRGLDPSSGLLVVIDGAKALATAVRSVFNELALIQRSPGTSAATSPSTCPRPTIAASTPARPTRSLTPTPARCCAPLGRWPASWTASILVLRPACGRSWREMLTMRRLGLGGWLGRCRRPTQWCR